MGYYLRYTTPLLQDQECQYSWHENNVRVRCTQQPMWVYFTGPSHKANWRCDVHADRARRLGHRMELIGSEPLPPKVEQ